MLFAHVTIPLILMLQGLTHGWRNRRPVCKGEGWQLYEPDGLCIQSVESSTSSKRVEWLHATDLCRKDGGGLVRIETVQKIRFVQEIRDHSDQPQWIGLRDSDKDGTFRYTNGTDLAVVPEAGDGLWSKNYKDGRGHCVAVDKHDWGLVTFKCDKTHGYLCERSPEIEEDRVLPTSHPPPQDDCDTLKQPRAIMNNNVECVPGDWVRVDEGGDEKHINMTVVAFMNTFEQGKKICEQFEGTLAKVRSQEAAKVIGGLISDRGNETGVFIGLVKSKEGDWTWVDGTLLGDKDYQNWNQTSSEGEDCVMVKGPTVQWFPVECDTSGFCLCEGEVPCGPRPVITVSGGGKLHGDVELIDEGSNTTLKCSLRDEETRATNVTLACQWDPDNPVTGGRSVSKNVTARIELNGKKCRCQSLMPGYKTVGESEISMEIHANPVLAEENDNVTLFVAKVGNSVDVSFEAFVSPPEARFELRKEGEDRAIQTGQYDVFVSPPVNGSIYTKFSVYMDEVLDHFKGNYQLILDNCMDTKLTYKFSLRTIKGAKASSERAFFTLETGIYIAVGTSFAAFLVVLVIISMYIQQYKNQL